MADGSLDLTVRIEPKDMIAACTLFGQPGLPIVLGRLVMDHEKPKADIVIPRSEDKPKGGPLAQLAGQWCHEENFREFLMAAGGSEIHSSTQAADWVRNFCGVTSRAEIDSNPDAKAKFLRLRADYMNWSGA
jgi:hypothetical protein